MIDVRTGSLIFRIRSSFSRFEILQRLERTGILPQFFEVEEVELRLDDDVAGDGDSFRRHDLEKKLFDILSSLRPVKGVPEAEMVNEIKYKIMNQIDPSLQPRVILEYPLNYNGKRLRTDLLVEFLNISGNLEFFPIEVIQPKTLSAFFVQLTRILEFPTKAILVVLGDDDLLDRIKGDIERLSRVSGKVMVVPVSYAH